MEEEIELEDQERKCEAIRFSRKIGDKQITITIPEQVITVDFEKQIKMADIQAEVKIVARVTEKMPRKDWEMTMIRNNAYLPEKEMYEWFEKNGEVRAFVVENNLYAPWVLTSLVKNENRAVEMLGGVLWSESLGTLDLYFAGKTYTFPEDHPVFKIFELLEGEVVNHYISPVFYSPECLLGLVTKLDAKANQKVLRALQKGKPLEKVKDIVISEVTKGNRLFGGKKEVKEWKEK